MTEITLETAALADVIKKAAIVAPTTGLSFDKSAGIQVTCRTTGVIEIKATDTQVYLTQWLMCSDPPEKDCTWLLDSKMFSVFLGSLPIGSGNTVTLAEETVRGRLRIKASSGRTKMTFFLMDESMYPIWTSFDPTDLRSVVDLGERLSAVAWAVARGKGGGGDGTVLSGVHLNGEFIIATDRYKFAASRCELDLEESITLDPSVVSLILRQTGEIKFGINQGQLLLMPDEYTQMRVILYSQEYPKCERIMVRNQPDSFEVAKPVLVDILRRATAIADGARGHRIHIWIGENEFALQSSVIDKGILGDAIPITGTADHERLKMSFAPDILMGALSNSPSDLIKIWYDRDDIASGWRIDGGNGYESWVRPLRDIASP